MRHLFITVSVLTLGLSSAYAQPTDCCDQRDAADTDDEEVPAEESQTQPATEAPPPAVHPAAGPGYYAPVADDAAPTVVARDGEHPAVEKRVLHGFRVGYGFVFNYDKDPDGNGEKMSLKDEFEIENPHNFLLGYEAFYRLIGHDWLNVLLVGNVTIAGIEQSKILPQASGLIGAEIHQSFQFGVGINVTPEPDRPAHMIAAAGWTPRAGSFYVPVHVFFIPDIDGFHRMGVTTGVTW